MILELKSVRDQDGKNIDWGAVKINVFCIEEAMALVTSFFSHCENFEIELMKRDKSCLITVTRRYNIGKQPDYLHYVHTYQVWSE